MVVQTEETGGYPWYALWVRSRHEKSVAAALAYKGFETLVPSYRTRRRWSDRLQDVELPLIPGYVFCQLDVSSRLPVLTTPGVVQIVGSGKTPEAIDSAEMHSLITAVRAGLHLRLWPFLRVGERVEIQEGPLRSVQGILINIKGEDQLVLSVSLLQRSIAVTVDRSWIRPLGNSARFTLWPQNSERLTSSGLA